MVSFFLVFCFHFPYFISYLKMLLFLDVRNTKKEYSGKRKSASNYFVYGKWKIFVDSIKNEFSNNINEKMKKIKYKNYVKSNNLTVFSIYSDEISSTSCIEFFWGFSQNNWELGSSTQSLTTWNKHHEIMMNTKLIHSQFVLSIVCLSFVFWWLFHYKNQWISFDSK